MTFEELRAKIYDRIQFGDGVMRELNGDDIENYNIRLLTLFDDPDEKTPFLQLRYELKGDTFRVWTATEDGNGITGIPKTDNFEEALDIVTRTVLNALELFKDQGIEVTVNWLGD